MPVALLTPYLAGYRIPLFERLAREHGVEVILYGGGQRYVPSWIAGDLEAQARAAPFPARHLTGGARGAYALGRQYDAVIAPYAGGTILPAAYLGARRHRRGFVLWASVWNEPHSFKHSLARPMTRRIYRRADAVVAYGEHVRFFVRGIRERDVDVFVAPQAVEADLFGRTVEPEEIAEFRARHGLPLDVPLVLYVGRLVPEKGVDVLLRAWEQVEPGKAKQARLVLIGEGPLARRSAATERTHLIEPLPREQLPVAYASSAFVVLPSVATRRFVEPWGLVCNEAMHQARPIIATDDVGAVAGGLVRLGLTGLVVASGDAPALSVAIERLLDDGDLRARLGRAAHQAVAAFNYDAMEEAFDRALAIAIRPSPTGP